MTEKTFNVSFFLTREKSNDDDTWFDRKNISNEIKSCLTDIDFQVDDIKIFNTIRKEID